MPDLSHERRSQLAANIPKYYFLRTLFKRLVFPILTIFLLRHQLSLEQIGILYSVGAIIGLSLEVPGGAAADLLGRRTALALAMVIQAGSMALFALGHSFAFFLVANALYFAGSSLMTGTHEAFLYETLVELGRKNELKQIVGRALFISQIATGALFMVVPLLAKFSLALPFWLNTIQFLTAAILAFTLTEPARTTVKQSSTLQELLGFRTFIANRSLVLGGLFFALIGGLTGFLADYRQVYLDRIHLDLAYFGVVYLALRLLTGLMGEYATRLERRVGRTALHWVLILSPALGYLGMALINNLYGLLFVILDGFEAGFSRPLKQEYLNFHINHANRASQISVFNFLKGIIRAGAVFIGGFLAQRLGLQLSFGIFGIALIVLAGPLVSHVLAHAPSSQVREAVQV